MAPKESAVICANAPVAKVATIPPTNEPVPLELKSPLIEIKPNEPVAKSQSIPPGKDPVPLILTFPII